MPLNARNTRQRHRCIWAGRQETVTLLAREPNMRAMVTRSVVMYRCLWGPIDKSGQILDDEKSSRMNRELHVPRSELDRVGVAYINALYYIVDKYGRFWTAMSDAPIRSTLWENYVGMTCHRIDPPDITYVAR